jgi:hypothetical protein
MRCLSFVLALGSVLASFALAAEPETDRNDSLRDPHKMVFDGAKSFSTKQIVAALNIDLKFQIAARLQQRLGEFLTVVEDRLRAGYASFGFPNTKVQAQFDSDRRCIVVKIDERASFQSGKIQIAGLDAAEAALLTQSLNEPFAPWDSVIVSNETAPGKRDVVWRQPDGRPVKMLKPVWNEGEPAPFDAQTCDEIRQRIRQHLAARGWLQPAFRVQVVPDELASTAMLVIDIEELGVPMTVGEIAIQGAVKNSREDVLACLGLQSGMRMTWRSFMDWNHKLWLSGRFVKGYVRDDPATRRKGKGSLDIKISLKEHPGAPALAVDLSREAQLMLKARDRLAYGLVGAGEDVVFEAHVDDSDDSSEQGTPAIAFDVRCVTGPGRGQVLTLNVSKKLSERPFLTETVVSRDDRVEFLSPQSGTRIDLQRPKGFQLWCIASLSTPGPSADNENQETGRSNFELKFRSNWSTTTTPMNMYVLIDPVAVLTLPHARNCQFTWQDGKLRAESEHIRFTIDESTARLTELRYSPANDGDWISFRTETGTLEREIARQDELAKELKDVFDPQRPGKSRVMYLLDEWHRFVRGSSREADTKALSALRKLIVNWSAPSIEDLFEPINSVSDSFSIPAPWGRWEIASYNPLRFEISPEMAGALVPVYRKLVPKSGAWWPVGRAALLCLKGGKQIAMEELAKVIEAEPTGPLAIWMLAEHSDARSIPPILLTAGDHANLSLAAFQAEYAPLLTGDSWLGECLLSLGEAIRHLDESERRSLLEWGSSQRQLTETLLDLLAPLTVDRRRQVRDVAPALLDRIWELTLHADIAETLRSLREDPPEQEAEPE